MNEGYEKVLRMLEDAGFEAYIVGGCVRDGIMGREINDYDITTNALPEQIITVFGEENIIPTGIKHGTVTVFRQFEVTTFRIDGEYSDSRRPDSVEFTTSLKEDLARRDFTINAVAMDLNGNITDLFGGRDDIGKKLIRCVGQPEKRFGEDALRILRAVRFASQLGFDIEPETAKAVHKMKHKLKNIAAERIRDELDKLICGKNCVEVLLGYSDVIAEVIPEFKPCIGFEQPTPYHRYNVWEHSIRAAASVPADDLLLRRLMLFHDIGKPSSATYDDTGRVHFKGHDNVGAKMTEEIMKRMHWDGKTVSASAALIANHSAKLKTKSDVKHMMSKIGDELFFKLMEVKKYDNLAKSEFVLEENAFFDSLIGIGKDIVKNNECRNISGLEISGNDLAELGLCGTEIGSALKEVLELVISEDIPNSRDALLGYVRGEQNA